ncbi:hypothetical protein JI739_19205 [Ramlibacter sp. AW1]|uniref:Uncharacterized protein n=1 Tax=Ramlibacter aurantiacus TaxID=2801330 RepID=A0A936ZJF7_9BURK|nr:hypothetical protein [Ramlibacter aurantiacus]MBL0422484.1 hypothetical protein [Ramlibacter aurantiacus]
MKIPQPRYQSPLGRMQPTPVDLDAVKHRGWQDQNILVISESDERLDFFERQLIRRIGERLYGSGGRHG